MAKKMEYFVFHCLLLKISKSLKEIDFGPEE